MKDKFVCLFYIKTVNISLLGYIEQDLLQQHFLKINKIIGKIENCVHFFL